MKLSLAIIWLEEHLVSLLNFAIANFFIRKDRLIRYAASATNCGAGSFVTTSGTYVDCCASASTSYGAGGCLMRISCIDSTRLFALPTATRTW